MITPNDVQNEIDAMVDTWPLVKLAEIKVSDTFVCASDHYRRTFGLSNYNLFQIVSKAKTMVRFGVVFDPGSEPSEIRAMTFKSAVRNWSTFRRATFSDLAKAETLFQKRTNAHAAQERLHKNIDDVYVLWNHASENLEPEAAGDYLHSPREGFVLEVYNGNGKLHERVRMLTDSDTELGCADGDAIERMVRAYVSTHFNREAIRKSAKFRIQHVPQMD